MSLLLAILLSAADGGFEPVVLDVHHGEVYLTTADGGSEPEPTLVPSGTFMDNATTSWVAANKANWRAQATVGPDWRWVIAVAGACLGIGVLLGGYGMWELLRVLR